MSQVTTELALMAMAAKGAAAPARVRCERRRWESGVEEEEEGQSLRGSLPEYVEIWAGELLASVFKTALG